jgi:hypothetical protein
MNEDGKKPVRFGCIVDFPAGQVLAPGPVEATPYFHALRSLTTSERGTEGEFMSQAIVDEFTRAGSLGSSGLQVTTEGSGSGFRSGGSTGSWTRG